MRPTSKPPNPVSVKCPTQDVTPGKDPGETPAKRGIDRKERGRATARMVWLREKRNIELVFDWCIRGGNGAEEEEEEEVTLPREAEGEGAGL